ncbi:glycosyltransferase family 2 protein [Candidatus Dojkabacteria bacterium]|uniref:Glycosyltransferase family 2 protein n=1 Tax=Candidatus Dojkabacteria bacterium TaxID=2099670 RepID=A0A955L110_9BACT|nr:glycosyltransferase family 2 protein [Candidatus Dojkabacteria bacterium]
MPCLNEAETLATCIKKSKLFLKRKKIVGEVLIADNGSTDGSQEIALKEGARLVKIKQKGYGSALIGGISASKGEYIIMGDADDSYDFTELSQFMQKLDEGYDLVMGNRFKGGIKKGAMPPLHKYVGNPVLSGIGKLFFRTPINDFHSGLRGFKKSAIIDLNLQTTGMEFASEMVVKATLNKLKITEVPIILYPDGRSRPPHLRSWRDGWRHLRFLLIFSPRWLFLYPGIIFMLIGFVLLTLLFIGPIKVGSLTFDVNTMMFAAISILTGFTIANLGLFSMIFSIKNNLVPATKGFNKFLDGTNIDYGIVIGLVIFILGLIGSIIAILNWKATGFGNLETSTTLRLVIPSTTFIVLGIQTIFTTFFINILNLPTKKNQ